MNLFKKLLVAALLVLTPIAATAVDVSYSTHEKTADEQLVSRNGSVCALLIMTDGTNNATVILYDVADSGDIAITNKITEITVVGSEHYGGRVWSFPVVFSNGLYADVTGTGASFIVEWRR